MTQATSEQKAAFRRRVDMWSNCRSIFGGWPGFLQATGVTLRGSNKRIRKKRAKQYMGAVIAEDLEDFGRQLLGAKK